MKKVYVVTWSDKEKNNFGVHKRVFFDHNEATQVALSRRSDGFNIESFVDECDLVGDVGVNACDDLCEAADNSSKIRAVDDVSETDYEHDVTVIGN